MIGAEKMKKERWLGHGHNMVQNGNGYWLDYSSAVEYMDDDIREELHEIYAPCTEQFFLLAYIDAHQALLGEPWELSKSNPVW